MVDEQQLAVTDLIDLLALGVATRSTVLPSIVRQVQLACSPWLEPTGEVVERRLEAALASGRVAREDDGRLRTTRLGEARTRALLQAPMAGVDRSLAPLCEAVKLAFLDLLEPGERTATAADLLAGRERALADLRRMLGACERLCPRVAACRRHQLVEAEAAAAGLRVALARRGLAAEARP